MDNKLKQTDFKKKQQEAKALLLKQISECTDRDQAHRLVTQGISKGILSRGDIGRTIKLPPRRTIIPPEKPNENVLYAATATKQGAKPDILTLARVDGKDTWQSGSLYLLSPGLTQTTSGEGLVYYFADFDSRVVQAWIDGMNFMRKILLEGMI